MAKIADLLQITQDERRAILQAYNMNDKDFSELIDSLKEWYLKSGFPELDCLETKIQCALLNSKMSSEKTKQCLKGYLQMRTMYSCFFEQLVPGSDLYNASKKYVKAVILPKLSPDLCRIYILRVSDPDGEASDALAYQAMSFMQTEMRLKSDDLSLSNILIIDFKDYGMKNLVKYTPTINTTLVNIVLTVNLRVRNIHLVNLSNTLDKVMFIMKTFLPSKFFAKVVTHTNLETLYDYISKEYLPKDLGGTQPSTDELHDEWCSVIEEEKEYFMELALNGYDRTQKTNNTCQIIESGMDGTFKKLAID